MQRTSAGILMYRFRPAGLEFLLVHPGGPFHRNKDLGAWSIPKGEYIGGEDPKAAAVREFEEELGVRISSDLLELSPVVQKAGKRVLAWALEGELDTRKIVSNTFIIEWPPRSGKMQEFPEVDRAEWFSADAAKLKINAAQVALIEELEKKLGT